MRQTLIVAAFPAALAALVDGRLGYESLKKGRTTLTSELGLGWGRFLPVDLRVVEPAPPRLVRPELKDCMIARYGVDATHAPTDITDPVTSLVVESGRSKTFARTDLGPVGVEQQTLRALHLRPVAPRQRRAAGCDQQDRLPTTNIVG